MPKGSEWFNFIYVTAVYVVLASGLSLAISFNAIYVNWPKYRCNPLFMPFSKNITKDFTFCVQNMQAAFMSDLLKPLWWIINNIKKMAGGVFGTLQNFRVMIKKIRDFFANIVGSIMAVVLNLVITIQKLAIAIKDTVGKVIGIVVTLLYMLDGSVKMAKASWNGPPGQMVRALCFHQDTLVILKNGDKVKMKDVRLGDTIYNGSKVNAVLTVANANKESFYMFNDKLNLNEPIYVTGSHYVLDERKNKYVQAKDHPDAKATDVTDDVFSCLITDDHIISIGGYSFWDWEDDLITSK